MSMCSGWIDNMVAAGESCIELYEEAFYFSSLSYLVQRQKYQVVTGKLL